MRKESPARQSPACQVSWKTRILHPGDRICAVAAGLLSVVAPVHIAVKCIQRTPASRWAPAAEEATRGPAEESRLKGDLSLEVHF